MKKSMGAGGRRAGGAGFTLIELLTVIAIISILAALSAVAVPRYLENARIVQAETNAQNIVKLITAKSTEAGNTTGYPAAYGFVLPEARDLTPAQLAGAPDKSTVFVTRPYTATIGMHGVDEALEVERFTQAAFDSNNDGVLGLLEYLPVGQFVSADNTYIFSQDLYAGPTGEFSAGVASPVSGTVTEISVQTRSGERRPLVYVPYNSRQLSALRRYWQGNGDEWGENIDFTAPDIQGRIFFPPPSYDAFVLVGNGPGGDNGGVVASLPNVTNPGTVYSDVYAYHLAAMRTAYLATRDIDGDGLLDFDFRARKTNATHTLPPDAVNRDSYGAFITKVD